MANKQPYIVLFGVASAIICGILAYHFYTHHQWINFGLFTLICIFLIISSQFSTNYHIRKSEKLLLAIQKKDFSLFPKTEGNNLLDQSVKLYYQSKDEHLASTSFRLLYESILSQMDIGLMILSEENGSWNVFYVNPIFLETLQIPKYNQWELYQDKLPDFYQLINQTNYENTQEFLNISIKEKLKHSYSLRTKKIQTQQHRFCIISLESVQKIVEQKEKLAWNNLMKVISHELLNTLTPVNSLIQNLEYISKQDVIDKDDQQEMQESLMIINSKSKQLLSFVDDYRQVAELPKPIFREINLKEIVEIALHFLKSEFEKQNITLKNNLEEHFIFADEKMIERCIINLYLNAMFAVSNQSEKEILTEIKSHNNRIILSISDSGIGISNEIKEKIFLPFFTTRDGGSGIGLTLSKSIMEAHKGYLNYQPLEKGSRFEMWFVK